MKNNDEKINLVKNKIKEDIRNTQKKLKINTIFSLMISILIMSINITIIVLAIWALSNLIHDITTGASKENIRVIILPTIVATFTICLFVLSILISIYKIKSKVFFYKTILEEYQYLILKTKEQSMEIDEVINILNEINSRKFEYKKLNYKHLAKKVLGG